MPKSAIVHLGVAHPWLCDAMGHLTTRHYLGMFDDATYHLFSLALGYDAGSEAWRGRGWADVRHVIEYKAEVGVGELVEIRGRLTRLGGKSVSSRLVMARRDGTEAAILEATTVHFDLERRVGIPLTDAIREAAEDWIA